jgi:2-succinyl-5-enolpyruvyl-6-hydroxy-3-cyclohexene-1-carboxylate synthase
VGAERQQLTHSATLARYVGAFVDSLVASGVDQVCLCPGSRSTPLAIMLMRHEGMRVWTHLDERSCAYFALGMAKASRRPVALLCSSGTAAVNFAPAVVEAFHARVPLIVLTADRPQELRDVGANQTIDQRNLYGAAAKWSVEMLLPEASTEALRYVRMIASRAVATALGDAPGPVHLNFPFREPLVPDLLDAADEDAIGSPAWEPASPRGVFSTRPIGTGAIEGSALWNLVMYLLEDRPRGVIVCGPQDDLLFAREVTALARLMRYPVLADPLSQVRCGAHQDATIISAYDSFLREPACLERLAPEIVLRFGAAPTSKALTLLVERAGSVALVTPNETWRDPELRADVIIQADATVACQELFKALTESDPDMLDTMVEGVGASPLTDINIEAWQAVERASVAAIASGLDRETQITEPGAFYELAALLPEGATVFAGNSMPVRDLDSFFPAGAKTVRFLANRGASGIDGVVSSALGASAVKEGRLVLLIGDLSFYHDMNGLLAAKRFGLDATIVLLNNDGGGIFSFLPQADGGEHFEALFGTPHGLDFAPVAQLYSLDYTRVHTPEDYREVLRRSFVTPGVSVIEVRTDRTENVALHQRIWRDVSVAAAEALS